MIAARKATVSGSWIAMRVPSAAILATSLLQVACGSVLGLGLLGAPRLGMRGVALGQVIETLTVDHLYGSRTIVFKNGGSTSCPPH